MPRSLFIDTGAFVARILSDDQYHQEAKSLWMTLENQDYNLLSSEHILDESATLIARKAGYVLAAEWLNRHLQSKLIRWLKTKDDDLMEASQLMKEYEDQRVSFTDCISFVLTKREKCKLIFTFDKHFELAGFNSLK